MAYTEDFKADILNKLQPPYNLSISELAKKEGVSTATIRNWLKQASKTKNEIRPLAEKKEIQASSERVNCDYNDIRIKVHKVRRDGLPDMNKLTGRVACIVNDKIIDAVPLPADEYPEEYTDDAYWKHYKILKPLEDGPWGLLNCDVSGRIFKPNMEPERNIFLPIWLTKDGSLLYGVTHWIEFPGDDYCWNFETFDP